MLLKDKVAIIYGAAGSIGRAIAEAYGREGAQLILTGRNLPALDALAERIRAAGGRAETQRVDALSESDVNACVQRVVERTGRLDISFNVIGVGDVQGTPLAQMKLSDYQAPIFNAVTTQFLTSRAAAQPMMRQRSGVILTFGGDGARQPVRNYSIGGFQVAMSAVDSLRRQLAAELGSYGIRVLTLESGGIIEGMPDMPENIVKMVVEPTLLGRAASFAEVGKAAVFAASDMASCMTGCSINITCGSSVN